MDTNVRRVLGRAIAGQPAALAPAALQAAADELMPAERTANWTHALMDVGARFCRPRRPLCEECPVRPWCAATSAGPDVPVVRARRPAPDFRSTSRWLRGRILDLARSADGDAWAAVEPPIGTHAAEDVAVARTAMAREGLLELHPSDAALVRLPR